MPAPASLRVLLVATGLGVLLSGGAQAQQRPSRLGDHGAWTAATHVEGGQKVCYAFTRATRSDPAGRSDVRLTVTHRPGQRDSVVLSAGYPYPRGAEVKLSVGATELAFYTNGSHAAARDSAAAIRAFRGGREGVARGPGAGGRGTATDSFSLSGFGAAHDAIGRECPAPGPRR